MHKKIFRILHIFTIFMFSGCSSANSISPFSSDEVTEIKVVGPLSHTQYWNENDFWDLSSLRIEVYLSNYQKEEIPFLCDFVTYECVPERPLNLPITNEDKSNSCVLEIKNISFKTKDNKEISIDSLSFNNITIVPYPYKKIKLNYPVIFLVLGLSIACVASAIIVKKIRYYGKKRRK